MIDAGLKNAPLRFLGDYYLGRTALRRRVDVAERHLARSPRGRSALGARLRAALPPPGLGPRATAYGHGHGARAARPLTEARHSGRAGGGALRRSSSERAGVASPARPENSLPAPKSRFTVAATSAARAWFRRMTKSWTTTGTPVPLPAAAGDGAGRGEAEPIRKNAESSVNSRLWDSTRPLRRSRFAPRGTDVGVSSETRVCWIVPTSTGFGR